MGRTLLTVAAADGLLADSALIAHGRGEAFDYLLGEQTCPAARQAVSEAAARLLAAQRPVLSLNGNAVALAADDMIRCAAVVGCPIEVNIYYRTPERMEALLARLEERRVGVGEGPPPKGWVPNFEQTNVDWTEAVSRVEILGAEPDARIPGLDGPRADCCAEGILGADVVLVPLEDGDRCEALVAMGKQLLVIDLNPMSRTAKTATVTIVDELMRCSNLLLRDLVGGSVEVSEKWDNEANLSASLSVMLDSLRQPE
jgi:4-phosphopantoate--beta-alanine ligase